MSHAHMMVFVWFMLIDLYLSRNKLLRASMTELSS